MRDPKEETLPRTCNCSVDDEIRVQQVMKKRTHYRNHDLNTCVRFRRVKKLGKIVCDVTKDSVAQRQKTQPNPNWTNPVPKDG